MVLDVQRLNYTDRQRFVPNTFDWNDLEPIPTVQRSDILDVIDLYIPKR
jgi:hypothetical protein